MTLWSEVSYRLRPLPILHFASSSFLLLFLSSAFYSFFSSFDLVLLPTIDPRVFLLPLPVLYKITLVTTVSARQGGLIRPLGVLTSLGRTNRFNSLPSRYTPLELPALQTIPLRRNDSAAAKSFSFYASLLLSPSPVPFLFLSLIFILFFCLFLLSYFYIAQCLIFFSSTVSVGFSCFNLTFLQSLVVDTFLIIMSCFISFFLYIPLMILIYNKHDAVINKT